MLTLATPPELEIQLETEAKERGLKIEDYALELLTSSLTSPKVERSEAERLEAIAKLKGMGRGSRFGSDAIRRDRDEDNARDEQSFLAS